MTTGICIIYEGEMKNGLMNGQGILVEKDGKYDGEFLNGKMHGEGVLNLNDGRVFKGEFKNGKYIGVSKSTNNEIAQTQNIKKVKDEQQRFEQDSRIEIFSLHGSRKKKTGQNKDKKLLRKEIVCLTNKKKEKKRIKRIETCRTLDDAMLLKCDRK